LDTLGLVGIAHIVHLVRTVNGRSELRSRIYLGDFNKVDDNSILPLWCINTLGNSTLSRFVKNPRSLAVGLWRHTIEEMHCLRSFLPDFYEAETARLRSLTPFETRALDVGGGGNDINYYKSEGTLINSY
jgi:DAPG hydrolase PhiG domain